MKTADIYIGLIYTQVLKNTLTLLSYILVTILDLIKFVIVSNSNGYSMPSHLQKSDKFIILLVLTVYVIMITNDSQLVMD